MHAGRNPFFHGHACQQRLLHRIGTVEHQPHQLTAGCRGNIALCHFRIYKVLGGLCLGIGEDFRHVPFLHHRAVLQNGHSAANLLHNAHLVGDDNHRNAHLGINVPNQLQNGVGGFGIQCAGRFIAQEYIRVRGKCPSNGHTLLLSAGKLGRIGVSLVRQAYGFQQLHGTFFCLFLAYACQTQGQHHVFQAGALHQQIKALEDHRDPAAHSPQLLLVHRPKVFAVNQHRTLTGSFQQVDAAHQRALACTGHANDAINVPVVNGQVHVLECIHRTT